MGEPREPQVALERETRGWDLPLWPGLVRRLLVIVRGFAQERQIERATEKESLAP